MASQPLLSVVVPFYGVADYFEECLESIRTQTYDNLQVILVDDESPDHCIDIAEKFAAMDSRFQVLRQANAGPGPARNTGIAHAEGDLLAFADGDDIVPRRAYEFMAASLRRTGSSIAMGNAMRFSRTSGVRQSWAHGRMCSKDATATHVLERPALTYDRMLWNKVYRREFFDEFQYQFPAIRYEDWPVVLKSHLDALTVDVLKAPVYYWRERESGDSITQQVFAYDNLLDRIISAEMIFDLVERQGSPAVRAMTQRHLLEVDMIAIAQAFAVVPDEDIDPLLGLSQRFMSRLDPPRPEESRFTRLQYHALIDGNVELLRSLARFRAEGGLAGGTVAHRLVLKPWKWRLDYPGRSLVSASIKNLYDLPVTALRLQTLVTSVHTEPDRFHFEIRAQIGHLEPDGSDVVSVSLVNGIHRIPLAISTFDTTDSFGHRSRVGVRFDVDLEQVRAIEDLVWPLRFEVSRTSAGVRRTGMLTGAGPGSPQYPMGTFFSPEQYVQPGLTTGNIYCLHRVAFPAVLEHVRPLSDGFELSGSICEPARRASVVVTRPDAEVTLPASVEQSEAGAYRFRARVDATDLLHGDQPDDPFLQSAIRAVVIRTEFGDTELSWPGYRGDAVLDVAGQDIRFTRSRFGMVKVALGPVLPTVRQIAVEGDVAVLTGPHHGLDVAGHLAWRRYLPGSDDHVDTPVEVTVGNDHFTARTALTSLIPEVDQPTQPGAPAADLTLFFRAPGYDTPVRIEPSAVTALPIERVVAGRGVVVTTIAGSNRVQVR
ncbi:glycosyltransferase family 2 protein [Dermacoccus nishinomiyaensis]|uniref:glycosyltransferase family 2 protein n=1 Tax=Dermacoccus nishinomiyaensis TaxID=1274 RepID=UPI00093D7417|nr:glycosyltransferase [Dermacoccus nishinomiyaensis]MCT1603689.1 glycosyltransferase [Dermacoccus nishinomiyaensis]